MGEEFTPEEKVILGEEPEPQPEGQTPPAEGEKAPEGEVKPPEGEKPPEKESERTDEEKQAIEQMGLKVDDKGFVIDEEGTRIPFKRWNQIYGKYRESERKSVDLEAKLGQTEQKHKLLRIIGPEKYYAIYPDEAPEGFTPAEKKAAPKEEDPFDMVADYKDPNHPFHGKTLREIYKEDPAEGRRLERIWEQGQQKVKADEQRQRETAEQTKQRLIKESEDEITTFSSSIAKELFGKEATALTKEEEAQVSGAIQDTLNFMQKTRRGAGILADAYFLMNREKIVNDARTKGGKAALESLQKPSVPSINSGGGAAVTGMDAYEAMTSDQLARAVEAMPEKQYAAFMKNASSALKAKHPSIPWD
jgi:hypothetical protein